MPAGWNVVTVSLNPAIDRVIEVPNLALGGHQRGRTRSRQPAGKGVNVSRALAALGTRSIATGFLGHDDVELFERSLDPSIVQAQFLAVEGRTRENITLVDPEQRIDTHVRDVGFTVHDTELARLRKKLALLCDEASLVLFCGSVPDGIDPPAFVQMLAACVGAGARVVVDTSGPFLAAASKLSLWMMKPNAAELGDLTGGSVDDAGGAIAAAGALVDRIQTILVSLGSEGSVLLAGGRVLRGRIAVPPERVRNTVGGGDCLLAGYVGGIANGLDVADAYRQALAVGAAATVGLATAQFTSEDVAEFLPKAEIEDVTAGG
jgi:1-phosphofructokinase